MTPSIRALKIIVNNPDIRPSEFAEKMWPDSLGHKKFTRCGYGTHRGGGMHLAGGGFLGRLRRKGLIGRGWKAGYYLTNKGFETLGKKA